MIKEAYVSYEVSKLLKEKGFSEETNLYYNSEGSCEPFSAWVEAMPYDYSPMPTLQMACAWLREKHFIIVVKPLYFDVEYYVSRWGYDIWADDNLEIRAMEDCYEELANYEDAVEAALKYSLENLL